MVLNSTRISIDPQKLSISDIDKKLSTVGGDMLQIEFLENALKNSLPTEVKKYSHIRLADLYTKRLMIGIAARNYDFAAETAINQKEKKELYLKEVLLLVKNLGFDEADKIFKKVLTVCNTSGEKEDAKNKYKTAFLDRALELERAQNMKKASELYEKYISLDPANVDIKKKLAGLYLRLGKIKESIALDNAIKNPKLIPPPQVQQEDFDINDLLR